MQHVKMLKGLAIQQLGAAGILERQCVPAVISDAVQNLHLKHHCIPATSANVERVFSAILHLLDEVDLVIHPWNYL